LDVGKGPGKNQTSKNEWAAIRQGRLDRDRGSEAEQRKPGSNK
jgi:hypothetical protein